MSKSSDAKVVENRMRRAADRRGLVLIKSRRRDQLARDFGAYSLVDPATKEPVPGGWGLSLEQIADLLSQQVFDLYPGARNQPPPSVMTQSRTTHTVDLTANEIRELALAAETGLRVLRGIANVELIESAIQKLREA